MSKWEMVRLGDVCDLITKGTTPTTLGFEFVDEGIGFVKIESISDTGTFIKEKFQYITNDCNAKLKRSKLKENDILFSIAGALGRTAIVTKDILPANTNQALAIIRISNKNINLQYILMVLKSNSIYKQFQKQKQGVAQLNLSLTNISDLKIPLPSLEIQEKIARNLDLASELVKLHKTKLEELDKLTQSVFYDMFGDPVTNEKGWSIEKLGDTVKLQGGYAFKSKDYVESGTKLVQISNVSKDVLVWNDTNFVPITYLEKYSQFLLKEKDLVIAMTRPVIKSLNSVKIAFISKADENTLLNQRVGRFVFSDNHLNKIYFKMFCQTKHFMNLVELFAGNSLQPNVSSSQIESVLLAVPPLHLQQKFANIVTEIEKQKEQVQKALDDAQMLYNSLMQEYFG